MFVHLFILDGVISPISRLAYEGSPMTQGRTWRGGRVPARRTREMGGKKPAKKPVFGQLTLTGELALDWMKPDTEVIVAKIEIGPIGAFPEYNVPEWASERSGDIGLIHDANHYANPILVTQRSILRALEIYCVEMEEQGANTAVEMNGTAQKGVIIFEENCPKLKFTRDKKAGQFAPYVMHKL